MHLLRPILLLLIIGSGVGTVLCQTATDALMMPRGKICVATTYSQSRWNHYWEGALYRDNPNLGTVTGQVIQPMFSLGLTNRLNVIAALPYVHNRASAGTFRHAAGFQDVQIALKIKALEWTPAAGTLSAFGVLGFSTPVSDYTPDYLPLALGLGSTNLTGRLLVDWKTPKGFYATARAAYIRRSNIRIERDFYYTDRAYYTNEVGMPDVADYGLSIGFRDSTFRVEAAYNAQNTLGGTDIRRNDMPFPSNRMNAGQLGVFAQWYLPFAPNFSVIAMGQYTLHGRNTGRATMLGGGVAYQF